MQVYSTKSILTGVVSQSFESVVCGAPFEGPAAGMDVRTIVYLAVFAEYRFVQARMVKMKKELSTRETGYIKRLYQWQAISCFDPWDTKSTTTNNGHLVTCLYK